MASNKHYPEPATNFLERDPEIARNPISVLLSLEYVRYEHQRAPLPIARQQKGSVRRSRTKYQAALLSAREADQRKDWIEQITTQSAFGLKGSGHGPLSHGHYRQFWQERPTEGGT